MYITIYIRAISDHMSPDDSHLINCIEGWLDLLEMLQCTWLECLSAFCMESENHPNDDAEHCAFGGYHNKHLF